MQKPALERKPPMVFKAHINVDKDGFVRESAYTTGSIHDSQVFKPLLTGDEKAMYADSAYKSKAHDNFLEIFKRF